jgi:hypothetical protein
MNKYDALTQVANDAIIHIREFALQTIQTISQIPDAKAPETAVASTTTEETTTKRRGRPRVVEKEETPVSTVAEVITITQEADFDTDEEEEALVFDLEKRIFPAYTVQWFQENLETGRQICRNLLSVRLQQNGGDHVPVRQEMMKITKCGKVTDFTAENCAIYYQTITPLLTDDDGDLM